MAIKRFHPCGNDMTKFILVKPLIDHENFVHCGVNVLSMSKQIMMEVTAISEDSIRSTGRIGAHGRPLFYSYRDLK